MTNITPTKSAVRWGSEKWQLFDYYAHPTRDVGGNPVLIFRHGGGGVNGHYQEVWDDSLPWFGLFTHLHASHQVHFDIISIESGQRGHHTSSLQPDKVALGFRNTKKMYLPEAVYDLGLGIASIKAQCRAIGGDAAYSIDPNRVVLFGQSYGATLAGLTVLNPPVSLTPGGGVFRRAPNDPTGNYDSTVLACLFMQGQIDCRTVGGVSYLDPSGLPGWYGTYYGSSTEWDALPESIKIAMSVKAYFELGATQYMRPFYVLYQVTGAGFSHPLVEYHHETQGTELDAAIRAAGGFSTLDIYTSSGVMTSTAVQRVYQWLAHAVAGAWEVKPWQLTSYA